MNLVLYDAKAQVPDHQEELYLTLRLGWKSSNRVKIRQRCNYENPVKRHHFEEQHTIHFPGSPRQPRFPLPLVQTVVTLDKQQLLGLQLGTVVWKIHTFKRRTHTP